MHDAIERELGMGGAFTRVRDIAAKAAENVARLAGLFHVLEHGVAGAIEAANMLAAERIVKWHLHEARRVFATLDSPLAPAAALRLDTWLLNEARVTGSERTPTTRVYQYGPSNARESRVLRALLVTLEERGRARIVVDGMRRLVVVNPELMNGKC